MRAHLDYAYSGSHPPSRYADHHLKIMGQGLFRSFNTTPNDCPNRLTFPSCFGHTNPIIV